ncbi:molybdenum cofactor biosynthesis protein MoaE [Parvibium lacunae]|uniref:Molybdopterin synthase catalytic subunit n=1 Tax=Parvibium lacunae TaxID=1888893 RepID=A0A368L6Z7_9BURK|nr:molybdenum cofactor biosynthesis protein MoaE [Parvibium lacunae]RCS59423.1 molybdenum cofactor biosynthesis protein MoaE [Parvibium lacunae]
MTISIQTNDFDVNVELQALRAGCADPGKIGAIASFIGLARDLNDGDVVNTLELEHYPGMTEKALSKIEADARARWPLLNVRIIHRIGTLLPQAQIVLVLVASSHRAAAFAACEFIMDTLKTTAPFWKKEQTAQGTRWVEAKASDEAATARWRSVGSNAAPEQKGS